MKSKIHIKCNLHFWIWLVNLNWPLFWIIGLSWSPLVCIILILLSIAWKLGTAWWRFVQKIFVNSRQQLEVYVLVFFMYLLCLDIQFTKTKISNYCEKNLFFLGKNPRLPCFTWKFSISPDPLARSQFPQLSFYKLTTVYIIMIHLKKI